MEMGTRDVKQLHSICVLVPVGLDRDKTLAAIKKVLIEHDLMVCQHEMHDTEGGVYIRLQIYATPGMYLYDKAMPAMSDLANAVGKSHLQIYFNYTITKYAFAEDSKERSQINLFNTMTKLTAEFTVARDEGDIRYFMSKVLDKLSSGSHVHYDIVTSKTSHNKVILHYDIHDDIFTPNDWKKLVFDICSEFNAYQSCSLPKFEVVYNQYLPEEG